MRGLIVSFGGDVTSLTLLSEGAKAKMVLKAG
jgi:hypothetical protein